MKTVETRKPPIEIRQHFFPEVNLFADPKKATPENQDNFGYDYKIDVEIGALDPDAGVYPVLLRIETCELEGKVKGYDAKITAVAFFALDPNVPDDRREGLLAISGASLLYSATREYLYTLTLRGPFPPIYLPTISFIPVEQTSEQT